MISPFIQGFLSFLTSEIPAPLSARINTQTSLVPHRRSVLAQKREAIMILLASKVKKLPVLSTYTVRYEILAQGYH